MPRARWLIGRALPPSRRALPYADAMFRPSRSFPTHAANPTPLLRPHAFPPHPHLSAALPRPRRPPVLLARARLVLYSRLVACCTIARLRSNLIYVSMSMFAGCRFSLNRTAAGCECSSQVPSCPMKRGHHLAHANAGRCIRNVWLSVLVHALTNSCLHLRAHCNTRQIVTDSIGFSVIVKWPGLTRIDTTSSLN
jgi:hypothetical protein